MHVQVASPALPLFGKTLLLKSNTGNGHGMPTASHAVKIARYHPLIKPKNPKPPAICSSFSTCRRPASVVALATLKSAAAMNEKSMTRPKKVNVKKRLTLSVPIRNTKDAMALEYC